MRSLRVILVLVSLCGIIVSAQTGRKSNLTYTKNNSITSADTIYQLDLYTFKVDLSRNGSIGNCDTTSNTGGFYEGIPVLYNGGFFLSGKEGDSLWAACNVSGLRMTDFVPGIINESTTTPENKIYVVKRMDPHFGDSWYNWMAAVGRGAEFHDGDNDGLYAPIDLNGNGQWDFNEDSPEILGNITTFTTYNDGVSSELRHFNGTYPKGIVVQQTAFGYGPLPDVKSTQEIMFVRYRILNTGTSSSLLDSVYFTIFGDGDIEDSDDDLMGTDTVYDANYVYNSGITDTSMFIPPTIGFSYIEGPVVYVPGVSFIDQNNNGVYDAGVDIALKTAAKLGRNRNMIEYPGAMNLGQSSSNQLIFDNWLNGIPQTISELRNYQLGKRLNGSLVDPCNWTFGTIKGSVPCSQMNPLFLYTGNPEDQIGWLNNYNDDQMIMNNIGPFKLEINKPVDVIVAYVTARPDMGRQYISALQTNFRQALVYYDYRFSAMDVNSDRVNEMSFNLEQNYPNPFNPETKIRFSLSKSEAVRLSVYNVLGQEIKVLVNEEMSSGVHEVSFNGSELTSGIYFYKLTAGERSELKKMVLIK